MDGAPVARRGGVNVPEDVITAAGGWCAPSEVIYALHTVAPQQVIFSELRDVAEAATRPWGPDQDVLERWREEDAWLAAQLELCRRQHVEDAPESRIKTEYLRG